MGFYTNITISNDFWHTIAKDPQALVEYIGWAMNYGTNSPRDEAFSERPAADDYSRQHRHEVLYGGPQGVIVHKAQHADVPQVIVNTYGSRAIAAHELPMAIRSGWLKGHAYRVEHAQAIAKELASLARDIRNELKRDK